MAEHKSSVVGDVRGKIGDFLYRQVKKVVHTKEAAALIKKYNNKTLFPGALELDPIARRHRAEFLEAVKTLQITSIGSSSLFAQNCLPAFCRNKLRLAGWPRSSSEHNCQLVFLH